MTAAAVAPDRHSGRAGPHRYLGAFDAAILPEALAETNVFGRVRPEQETIGNIRAASRFA